VTDGATPLILWLIVAAIDAVFAGLPGLGALLAAPLAVAGGLARWFDARLNRAHRGAADLRIRGAVVVSFLGAVAWLAAAALHDLADVLPYGWLIEAVAILGVLGQRRPIDGARRVAAALDAGDEAAARTALAPLVRFDVAPLDRYGIARGAAESCAARLTEGLVGAAFWYLLLGLPGLLVYRAVNAMAGAIGLPSPRQAAFGFAARRLDDTLTLIPALIAGPLFVLAALFVPPSSPWQALRVWLADLAARPAAAAGRAEGALAGALRLALGGPRHYDGVSVPGSWIGDGRARATSADVRRASLLATVAALLFATLLAGTVAARLV
jgi:adenosylcobinamide-phosphate synthase